MDLVLFLETAQDRDRVLEGRLADEHGLESPLEGGVFLHVLPVLVERRGADAPELAPGQGRFQHVGGVHRPLGRAGADERMKLVDEEDDLSFGFRDFLENGLEALLELASVLGSRDEGAQVEGDDALGLEPLRDVALDDPLGETFGDRRLSDSGLPDEDRIVFRPAREDLDHAADLLVPSDHRVEFPAAGEVGEVTGVAGEGLVLVFRILIRDALASANFDHGGEDAVFGDAGLRQDSAGGAVVFDRGQKEMLDAHVFVLEVVGLVLGPLEERGEARGDRHLSEGPRTGHLGEPIDFRLELPGEALRVRSELLENGGDDALFLLEQGGEEVLDVDLLVVTLVGLSLGRMKRFLNLDGHLVVSHLFPLSGFAFFRFGAAGFRGRSTSTLITRRGGTGTSAFSSWRWRRRAVRASSGNEEKKRSRSPCIRSIRSRIRRMTSTPARLIPRSRVRVRTSSARRTSISE